MSAVFRLFSDYFISYILSIIIESILNSLLQVFFFRIWMTRVEYWIL